MVFLQLKDVRLFKSKLSVNGKWPVSKVSVSYIVLLLLNTHSYFSDVHKVNVTTALMCKFHTD